MVKIVAGRGGDTPGNLRRATGGFHTGGTCGSPSDDSTPVIPIKGRAGVSNPILPYFGPNYIKIK